MQSLALLVDELVSCPPWLSHRLGNTLPPFLPHFHMRQLVVLRLRYVSPLRPRRSLVLPLMNAFHAHT